jgi:hypothetical protein
MYRIHIGSDRVSDCEAPCLDPWLKILVNSPLSFQENAPFPSRHFLLAVRDCNPVFYQPFFFGGPPPHRLADMFFVTARNPTL